MSDSYTLQILHAADFEAATAALTRAPNFAAVVDALEEERPNSITLSSGDNYLPGPFIAAQTDASVAPALRAFYAEQLGIPVGSLSALGTAQGRFDIAVLNAIGVQASVFGNHEFDLGPEVVAGAIDVTASGGNASGIGAQFPYLSANLDFSAEPSLAPLVTDELRDAASYATTAADLATPEALAAEAAAAQIAPWTVIEENGERIGVIGVTTQTLASISSPGRVSVLDPAGDGGVDNPAELATILQPRIDALTAEGIDKIVLLSHLQQYQNELALAELLSGVDVLIAGGSDAIFADQTDALRPGDTAQEGYPVFREGADGAPVAVVNTGREYGYVGRLVLTFDGEGQVIEDSVDPAVSGAYVTTEEAVGALWDGADPFAEGSRGERVRGLTDALAEVINTKDGNLFGFTEVFLEGRRAAVRSEETNLGNLSSEANLEAAQAVDPTAVISIKNGGGIRAEIGTIVGTPPEALPPPANEAAGKPEGAVSQLDIENALRFNNGLALVTLTATELVTVIENAVRAAGPGLTPGAFPQVAGLSFSFDPARPVGDRVVSLAVLDEAGEVADVVVRDGEIVGDAARSFRTVTLDFLANPENPGDGLFAGTGFTGLQRLTAPAEAPRTGEATFAADLSEQDALAEYLAGNFATAETAFAGAETGAAEDTRIQNLSIRPDTVLEGVAGGGDGDAGGGGGDGAGGGDGDGAGDDGDAGGGSGGGGDNAGGGNGGDGPAAPGTPATEFRAASFNASLNRAAEGELIADLATPDDAQARTVAEIIQRNDPDILLVNEFDYVPYDIAAGLFRLNYLERPQDTLGTGAAEAITYPHAFVAPSNTGIASGSDLNNDGNAVTVEGAAGYGDDALGFGAFPGQYGMAVFSKYPILEEGVRTFQNFLWKDMPGARLPDDPSTPAPADWYSAEELAKLPLPSKSFWDIPVLVDGEVVHVIALHPTPPTFDGPEDRNGLRNADEIRLAADYVTPGRGGYIYDDAGKYGGLEPGARFVVMGDLNADPIDGDSANQAVLQILGSDAVDASLRPASAGGPEQAALQGGANAAHRGDPAFDTADFADTAPGNLRVDYVLPSEAGLAPRAAGVFWPQSDDPLFPLVGTFDPALPGGFPSSDHRLVWNDLALAPDARPGFATLDGEAPIVVGHRGASAERPEHTIEAYRLAIEQGADFIEPDLVVTKDGVLIARHEPEIGGTTDVADRPEFAGRRTTKMLDGVEVDGWWAEDFTLAEIKTLYARERIPEVRPGNTEYDDQYRIPTLAEVIELVKETEAETGRKIGIVPETKHPTYFEYEGKHLDGTPIHQDTSALLVETLVKGDFTDPGRVIIQSFELANLIELQTKQMPEAGIDVPLLQLMNEGGYDIAFNLDPARGGDPDAYAGFAFPLTAESAANGDLYTPEALRAMKALYAEGIGPYKDDILPVRAVTPPVDGDGDGRATITRQVTGEVTSLLDDAHEAGLEVIIYTLRDEEPFQSLNPDGTVRPAAEEYDAFIDLGVDGFFTDSPGSGRAAVDRAVADLL